MTRRHREDPGGPELPGRSVPADGGGVGNTLPRWGGALGCASSLLQTAPDAPGPQARLSTSALQAGMSIKMIEAVQGQRPGGQRRWEPRGWSVSTEKKLTSRGSTHVRVEAEIQGHPQLNSELEASLGYKKLWEKMLRATCVSSVPTACAVKSPSSHPAVHCPKSQKSCSVCYHVPLNDRQGQRHPVASLRTHDCQKHIQRQAATA